MGVDRPSRSSEDDDPPRRPARGQPEQKPPERGETKPSRPERPQSQAEQRREADRRAAEAYRERHNSMTGAERRQAIRDKQAQYIAEEKEKASRSPEAKHAEAKAYLEQRKARIEAYERGDLPKDQLSRSERNDARKREFDRFVAAQKAKEEREATKAEREQGRARPDTAPPRQADRPATGDSSPDRPRTGHEREPADRPRRHETREEADTRIEARERAEQQAMTLEQALANVDEEEGPDDDFAALGRGDNPYDATAEHADKQDGSASERTDTKPDESRPAEHPEGRDAKQAAEAREQRAAAEQEMREARVAGDRERLADAAEKWAEADSRSEQTRWTTIAEEEGGEVRSFDSYAAARRAVGDVPGTQIHHIVEQSQAKPERSGFDVSRINSTDNLTRIPKDVHERISAEYSTKDPFARETPRDQLSGAPWEEHYEAGVDMLNKVFEEMRDDD